MISDWGERGSDTDSLISTRRLGHELVPFVRVLFKDVYTQTTTLLFFLIVNVLVCSNYC